ncbi:ABC transporter ATP-binding protein [Endomicrobium proavitum]|uniref:ABC transporter ATP-binding protein n=1 Tax=Endomicrobium proavitum TaxID=1408281 RepID=UPI0006977240|nr:ABC transporter ATP-binding protein [Endomicrobium proavitum]
MIILAVKNLSVEYNISCGTVKAVRKISFNVKKGETFAVVGRSGSGKSSVASAVIGLSDIDGAIIKSGSITYDKKDFLKLSFEDKRKIRGKKISMIFQDPQSYLNPVVKIRKQMEESWTAHNPKASKKEIKTKVSEVLKKVRLDDAERILNSYPHMLSGGQKQRILIAMAIINEPEILIADEPTTGLDAAIQKQILDLLKDLKKSLGLTMIIITHNMKVAKKYSDTIAVMHAGKIIETGATARIFKNPKNNYTKLLINS